MMAAFQQEEGRIINPYKALLRDESTPVWEVSNHSYKARSVYYRQLRRFRHYFPKSQILLLSTERLAEDPLSTMRQVYEFIGVDPALGTTDILKENVGANKEAVPEEVRAFFQPSHQAFVREYGSVYPFP